MRPPRTLVTVSHGEPSPDALAAAALRWRAGKLDYSYRCPRHGTAHTVPYAPAFARQYLAAVGDGACCCPGRAGWPVRVGLSRTRLLAWLLVILWSANVADLVLTLKAIALGKATEANRLMDAFFRAGSDDAIAFKLGVATAAVVVLWLARRRPVVLPASVLLTTAFVALVAYEALSLYVG